MVLAMLVALGAQACGGVVQTRVEYDAQSCVEQALRRGGDAGTIDAARDQFTDGCERGDAAACSQLGVMYEYGLAVAMDVQRAKELYDRACNQGNRGACVNYGKLLAEGAQVATAEEGSRLASVEHGIRVLSQACREGDARGCGELGRLLLTKKHDTASSVVLLRQACEGGHSDSCYLLGSQFDHGEFGNDPVEALAFYQKACGGGHQRGCLHLDLIYAKISARRSSVKVAAPSAVACAPGEACHQRTAQRQTR